MLVGEKRAKPFLKWVGGKSQLLPQYSELFPKNYNTYFEPFVGGGAVFFYLQTEAKKAHINDINSKLINAYQNIRDKVDKLVKELKTLESEYHHLSEDARKEFFYTKRDEYNTLPASSLNKTVLLIFLNRTCFNGLFRENSKGGFNVPFGKNKNPTICNEENLRNIATTLTNTTISNVSFNEAVSEASKGDFVYFDPPYHPVNATSNFTSYSEGNFGTADQERLKKTVDVLHKRGCLVMVSNSDTEFIRKLYKGYRQEQVYAGRSINAVGTKRGKISELVILNY